jgi:hypothetical protein
LQQLIGLLGLLAVLLTPVTATAAQSKINPGKHYAFLKGGLKVDNLNRCQQLAKKNCQWMDQSCMAKILSHDFCQQTRLLLKQAVPWATLATLSASSQGNLAVVQSTTIADGVDIYSIVSPQGRLINTDIDPRKLSKQVQQKYAKKSFIVLSGPPRYMSYPGGKQAIIVKQKINSPCLACALFAQASVKFEFSKQGKLIDTRLLEFTEHTKNPADR